MKSKRVISIATILIFVLSFLVFTSFSYAAPPKKPILDQGGESGTYYGHGLGLKLGEPHPELKLDLDKYRMREPLASSADLTEYAPPIGNQGYQNSCVGWSVGYYLKTWYEKYEHAYWNLSWEENQNESTYCFSPSYIYNQINGGVDEGAYFDDAFVILEQKGDTDCNEFPYDVYNFLTQPTDAQKEAAKQYSILDNWGYFFYEYGYGPYYRPDVVTDLKAWLDSGKPLVMGIPIYNDFPSSHTEKVECYDYDGYSYARGRHGVFIAGYDDNAGDGQGGFLTLNSWGPTWNVDGMVYLSYDFIQYYAYQAWSMEDIDSSPTISSLNPDTGEAGDLVTIEGNNFGTDRRLAEVTFPGDTNATVTSWENDEIKVEVPCGAVNGDVLVYDWDSESSNGKAFSVTVPGIDYVDPTSGAAGDTVTIAGSAFGSEQGSSCVSFGGVQAVEYTTWSNVEIKCKVPLGVSGLVDVTVTTGGGTSNGVAFSITLGIDNIDPTSGAVGDTVTIAGSAFGSEQGSSYVSFDVTQADEYTYWTDNEIHCRVPLGASGLVDVTVTTSGGTSEGVAFGVTPVIDQITPTDGLVGTEVTIVGSTFGSEQGSSYTSFGGVQAVEYTYWSDDEIKCNVPGGASGLVDVTVITSGGASNGVAFSVTPVTDEITPPDGPVGTEVTIAGSAFGSEQGSSYTSFGGVQAVEYTTWSNVEIKCKVPLGVSGLVDVTVTTSGGTSNGVAFNVTLGIDNIDPTSGAVGDIVTIWGSAFGSEQGSSYVSFGGVQAVEYTAWSDNEIKCKVPLGVSGLVVVTVTTGELTSNGVAFSITLGIDNIDPTSGAVGDTVTIAGSAFGSEQGSSYVSFALTQAVEYTAWSDNEIKCKIPAGVSGLVEVTVSTMGGTSNGIPFLVTEPEEPEGPEEPEEPEEPVEPVPEETKPTQPPAITWYLAEGSTRGGFETWVLIQNPGEHLAQISITYQTDKGEVAGPLVTLAPGSRHSINVADTIETYEVSTKVISDQPVVAERAMYYNNRQCAHDSVGYAID